jgi:hypothetical protein
MIISARHIATRKLITMFRERLQGVQKVSGPLPSRYARLLTGILILSDIKLRILQESETNDFDVIATSDKSWFQPHHGTLENVYPFGSKCHSGDGQALAREKL